MQITVIQGSPRRSGNTATLVSRTLERLGAAAQCVDTVYLHGMEIAPCTGCMACQKVTHSPGCVIDDDMQQLFERLLSSDCIVFASPVYCYSVSAQMKVFLDRISCLIKLGEDTFVSMLAGKRSALAVTAAGDAFAGADLIVETYRRVVGAYAMQDLGHVVATGVRGRADLARECVTAQCERLAAAMRDACCAGQA